MATSSREKHMCTFPGCNKAFSKASRLEIHSRSHTGDRPFLCKVDGCGKWFKRSDHARRHELLTHGLCQNPGTSPTTFICEEEHCSAIFQSKENLKKHERKTHGQESYRCHVAGCGQVFRKHHQLTTHRVGEHSEEAPYRCLVPGCEKKFPTPSKLKRHSKTHEGYQCSEPDCDAQFDKWSLLVTHRRIAHATVHKCDVCEKTFAQKQWLKQHLLTHAEKRIVFTCPHDGCGRDYLDKRNLTAHVRSYHDGKRFKCTEEGCVQTFTSKQRLKQHLKLHDPKRPPPKKKLKKKKTVTEHLTEVRINSAEDVLSSPDRIHLPDLPDLANDITPAFISHKHSEPEIIARLQQELQSVRTALLQQDVTCDTIADGTTDTPNKSLQPKSEDQSSACTRNCMYSHCNDAAFTNVPTNSKAVAVNFNCANKQDSSVCNNEHVGTKDFTSCECVHSTTPYPIFTCSATHSKTDTLLKAATDEKSSICKQGETNCVLTAPDITRKFYDSEYVPDSSVDLNEGKEM